MKKQSIIIVLVGLLFLVGLLVGLIAFWPKNQEEAGAGQTVVTLDGLASTSPFILAGATSTKSWTINTKGMKELGLNTQIIASSTDAASVLNLNIDVSEDGIDWYNYYHYDLNELASTTTGVLAISPTGPSFSIAPASTSTIMARLNLKDWNANFTRINFSSASTTLNMAIWAQAVKGY